MDIQVVKVDCDDKEILQNLLQLYCYEWSQYDKLDGLNKYVSECNALEELLKKYKRVRICLDTGRLHLQNKIDEDFNDIEIIKKFSKYTHVVHLWNARVGGISHFPVLPNLDTQEGWAPIGNYLKIIIGNNKNVKIMFEHRSDLISNEELDSCYSWINSIADTHRLIL